MHYLAPIPIIVGGGGAIFGLLWLVGLGAEDDGGPSPTLFSIFGMSYIGWRVCKALRDDPSSVLPAIGILIGSAGLIWLGIAML